MLRVDAPQGADIAALCDLAVTARNSVQACGLTQSEPIDILLTDAIEIPIGHALASFDSTNNRISVRSAQHMAATVHETDYYALLPSQRLFRSVLTHEMAHAVLHQSLKAGPGFLIDHEYVAAALEIAALSEDDRERMLATAEFTWNATAEAISITMYFIAPRRFALTAWRLHRDTGCAPIEGIVDGSYTFHRSH